MVSLVVPTGTVAVNEPSLAEVATTSPLATTSMPPIPFVDSVPSVLDAIRILPLTVIVSAAALSTEGAIVTSPSTLYS